MFTSFLRNLILRICAHRYRCQLNLNLCYIYQMISFNEKCWNLLNKVSDVRVRIKRIAIAKCDPFFNYRDANVVNSTKFAIPNFGRNISFLLFFFFVVTFGVLSRHFLRITHSRNTIISYFQWLDSWNTQQRESRQTRASSLSNQF